MSDKRKLLFLYLLKTKIKTDLYLAILSFKKIKILDLSKKYIFLIFYFNYT